MEYKGHIISSASEEIMLDILEVQKEILQELKKQNEPRVNTTITTVGIPIEEILREEVLELTEPEMEKQETHTVEKKERKTRQATGKQKPKTKSKKTTK